MDIKSFIKPELLILVPVLYLIGTAIRKSKINNCRIPLILGIISIVLSAVWVFSTSDCSGAKCALAQIFTAFTQGVLAAGASVYANQIMQQSKKANNSKIKSEN